MVLQLRAIRSLIRTSEEVIKEVSSKTIWSSVSKLNEAGEKNLQGNWMDSVNYYIGMFVRVIPGYSKYGEGEGCTSYKMPEGCHRGATYRDFKLAWPNAIQPSCNPFKSCVEFALFAMCMLEALRLLADHQKACKESSCKLSLFEQCCSSIEQHATVS